MSPSEHVIVVTPPQHVRHEAAVCEDHHKRIQSGEDFQWDPQQHVIYMGSDLKAAGEHDFEDLVVEQNVSFDGLIFHLHLRKRGSGEPTVITFRTSHAQARQAAEAFATFARKDDPEA